MYFSWTDIEGIHGEHFIKEKPEQTAFSNLVGTSQLDTQQPIQSLELLEITDQPYNWINQTTLFNARTGKQKKGITEEEAQQVANRFMLPGLKVDGIIRIEEVDDHHEYRGRPLSVYEISYKTPLNLKAYAAFENGAFQMVRFRDLRWLDFLWMTNTMDYQGRDDSNSVVHRAFSLLGLITVLGGFTLWFTGSPSVKKIKKNIY